MKKYSTIFICLVFLTLSANADPEPTRFTLREAKLVVDFLLKQKNLIWYCGWCDPYPPVCLTVVDVWYTPEKNAQPQNKDYTVSMKALDTYGTHVEYDVSLDYLYYKNGNIASSVEKVFQKSHTGIDNFSWDSRYFYDASSKDKIVYEEIDEVAVAEEVTFDFDSGGVPLIQSTIIIKNERKEPFQVYINGKSYGRVRPYDSIKVKVVPYNNTKIHVVQESGYILYASEYNTVIPVMSWGDSWTWSFHK